MKISTKVKPPTRLQPLLDYMSGRFTYRPRDAWQQLIRDGGVRCNGVVAEPETLVSAGDLLTTELPDPVEPDVNLDYEIIYEDQWLIVVNKPSNLKVHGKAAFIHANLIHHIRHVRRPAYPEAQLINRLDGDTSGAVLLARDLETLKAMQWRFRYRAVRKRYSAWVNGIPHPSVRVINRPIGQLSSLPGVYRFGCGPAAALPKPAATRLRVIETFAGRCARLELAPYTGRTHQLRVHLAEIGHPLIGDLVYQHSDEAFLARHADPADYAPLLLDRHALHCDGYTFVHPASGQIFAVHAPLPADLVDLNRRLAKL